MNLEIKNKINALLDDCMDYKRSISIIEAAYRYYQEGGGKIEILIYPKENTSARCETIVQDHLTSVVLAPILDNYQNLIKNNVLEIEKVLYEEFG